VEEAESDIYTKFHVLKQYGGIFLDMNILITKPLTSFRLSVNPNLSIIKIQNIEKFSSQAPYRI
jgi:hypothetical protein